MHLPTHLYQWRHLGIHWWLWFTEIGNLKRCKPLPTNVRLDGNPVITDDSCHDTNDPTDSNLLLLYGEGGGLLISGSYQHWYSTCVVAHTITENRNIKLALLDGNPIITDDSCHDTNDSTDSNLLLSSGEGVGHLYFRRVSSTYL